MRAGRVVRRPFEGNVIPSELFDPVALKMLQQIPLPNLPGNVDNWQGSVYEQSTTGTSRSAST